MARIEVTTHIEAPPERVWEVLIDWETQPTWMVDAHSVAVRSPNREGAGVVIRCVTDLGLGGPVRVVDDLEVVDWRPAEALGMRHVGRLIRGLGSFDLSPTAHGTRVEWWEELEVPFGGVGDAAAGLLAVPYTAALFRRSLSRLKRVCESASVRP